MTAMWQEIGGSLRLLRLARAWSLARAAAAAGLPLPRLSQIELGKANPSHALLEHIVAALGFPMVGLEIARLMLARTAASPRDAPVPPPAAAVAVLPLAAPAALACGFRRRRPPIPTEGDHLSERGGERRLMVG